MALGFEDEDFFASRHNWIDGVTTTDRYRLNYNTPKPEGVPGGRHCKKTKIRAHTRPKRTTPRTFARPASLSLSPLSITLSLSLIPAASQHWKRQQHSAFFIYLFIINIGKMAKKRHTRITTA